MDMSDVHFPMCFNLLMSNLSRAPWKEDWHTMSKVSFSVLSYSNYLNKSLELLSVFVDSFL